MSLVLGLSECDMVEGMRQPELKGGSNKQPELKGGLVHAVDIPCSLVDSSSSRMEGSTLNDSSEVASVQGDIQLEEGGGAQPCVSAYPGAGISDQDRIAQEVPHQLAAITVQKCTSE